jgi:hypothetical protein
MQRASAIRRAIRLPRGAVAEGENCREAETKLLHATQRLNNLAQTHEQPMGGSTLRARRNVTDGLTMYMLATSRTVTGPGTLTQIAYDAWCAALESTRPRTGNCSMTDKEDFSLCATS